MSKTVLVTGADGFIGSHLVEALVKSGYQTKAFCFYNSFGHKGWLETTDDDVKSHVEFIMGDVRDSHAVEASTKGVDIIFHLASLIAIPYSYVAPTSYVDTNITGTLNVLQAARKHSTEQVIHTSTSEVYGTAQYVPIDEKHPCVGQSPYSATKIAADQLALSFHKSFNTPISIVRPFNTYGPRQSTRAVIPTIITQCLAGASQLKLGNLTATRDFNYVKDTVAGMMAFMGNQDSLGRAINIGSNYEISIGETASLIADIFDLKFDFDIEQSRIRPEHSEVERLWADNSLARLLLGWVPKYSGTDGFRRGLIETIEWFEKNKEFMLSKQSGASYAI